MQDMLRQNSYKDQLVREMTEQVNESETKLHSYQISELMNSRRRQLEQRAKAPATQEVRERYGGHEKGHVSTRPGWRLWEAKAKERSEVSIRGDDVGASAAAAQFDSASCCSEGVALDASTLMSPATEPTVASSRLNSAGITASSVCQDPQTPISYRSHRRGSSGGLGSRSQSVDALHPEVAEGTGVSSGVGGGRGGCGLAGAGFAVSAAVFGQSYRPHPGDLIDQRVAEFVNKPANLACQALFCRLGEGAYLYGTQRVCLRAEPRTDQLEALHGKEWIRLQEFVKRMEASQSIHLRHAREAASGASFAEF